MVKNLRLKTKSAFESIKFVREVGRNLQFAGDTGADLREEGRGAVAAQMIISGSSVRHFLVSRFVQSRNHHDTRIVGGKNPENDAT